MGRERQKVQVEREKPTGMEALGETTTEVAKMNEAAPVGATLLPPLVPASLPGKRAGEGPDAAAQRALAGGRDWAPAAVHGDKTGTAPMGDPVMAEQSAALRPPLDTARKQAEARNRLDRALKDLNDAFSAFDIQLKFRVHDKTHDIMVQVVNVRTGEVIREIPPKKILDMFAEMMRFVGVLLDEYV